MTKTATASSRRAGSKIVHTVFGFDGEVIGTRRSERQYNYAICRIVQGRHYEDGQSRAVCVRYSNTRYSYNGHFAVPVEVTL